MEQLKQTLSTGLIPALLIVTATPAFSYAGPGGVVGGIGALLGIIGTLFALLVGFIWYPVKTLLNKLRDSQTDQPSDRPVEE